MKKVEFEIIGVVSLMSTDFSLVAYDRCVGAAHAGVRHPRLFVMLIYPRNSVLCSIFSRKYNAQRVKCLSSPCVTSNSNSLPHIFDNRKSSIYLSRRVRKILVVLIQYLAV